MPHGEDVTYSLIVPCSSPFFRLGPLESYRQIHDVVAMALGAACGDVRLASQPAPKISEKCFENACHHDVLAGERKVAGAAQRRSRFGLLHQGSIQANGAREAVSSRLGALLAVRVKTREVEAGDFAVAHRLVEEKYGRDDWLKRA